MEIPVYLFTGFLDAGKTSLIRETLQDPNFNAGEKTLVVLCEEGEEEIDIASLPNGGNRISIVTFDEEQLLTPDRLEAARKRAKAERVMVEYNGMWNIKSLYEALPLDWFVYEELMLADAGTILTYNANMRQLVYDKLSGAQMVIFNRVKVGADIMPYHALVRGAAGRAGIGYEFEDGSFIPDEIEDPLPFDIEADVVAIQDKDYAIWYAHISENMASYEGKTISYKGMVAHDTSMGNQLMAVGRQIMTCCEEDIAYRPLIVKWRGSDKYQTGDWVQVRGTIKIEKSPYYQGKGPVLYADVVTKATPSDPPVAVFY